MGGDLSVAFNPSNEEISNQETKQEMKKNKTPKNKTSNKTSEKKTKKTKDKIEEETKLKNRFDMLEVDVSDDEKPIKKERKNKKVNSKDENDASSCMLFEEEFEIPDDLYKTLNDHHFMPIKMSMSNYWGYRFGKNNTQFQFVICKKVEDDNFKEKTEIPYEGNEYDEYYVFVGYDNTTFIDSVINVNNHNVHKNYPRFCCSLEYNGRYFRFGDVHMIIFNYIRVYECSIENKPEYDDESDDEKLDEEPDEEPDNKQDEEPDDDQDNKQDDELDFDEELSDEELIPGNDLD